MEIECNDLQIIYCTRNKTQETYQMFDRETARKIYRKIVAINIEFDGNTKNSKMLVQQHKKARKICSTKNKQLEEHFATN